MSLLNVIAHSRRRVAYHTLAQDYFDRLDLAGDTTYVQNKDAINDLFVALDNEGYLSALSAGSMCLWAGVGWEGCDVPLLSGMPVPTFEAGWTSANHDVLTGCLGGEGRYVNTHYANNNNAQNDQSAGGYVTLAGGNALLGAGGTDTGTTYIGHYNGAYQIRSQAAPPVTLSVTVQQTGVVSISRSVSASFDYSIGEFTGTETSSSETPNAWDFFIFGRNNGGTMQHNSGQRVGVYWIGPAVSLSAMKTALDTYMAAITGEPPSAEEQPTGTAVYTMNVVENPDPGFVANLLADPNIAYAGGQGPSGENALEVTYVGNTQGSERVIEWFPLGQQLTVAALSYDVKFDADFQWVKGGKIHGLGPDNPATGGVTPTDTRWSTRAMWWESARAGTYVYHLDQSGGSGDQIFTTDSIFSRNVWYNVVVEITLNDVGSSNGQVRMLIDGVEITKDTGLQLRGSTDTAALIQKMMWSTFFGGDDDTWAPKDEFGDYVNVHALFTNWVVYDNVFAPPA